jgi:hypothetical protein
MDHNTGPLNRTHSISPDNVKLSLKMAGHLVLTVPNPDWKILPLA